MVKRLLLAALAACCLLPGLAAAADLSANSVAALEAALKVAKGGDRVLLAPGVYPNITLKYVPVNFDPAVTIASAAPAAPAQLSVMRLSGVKGLTFQGLEFLVGPAGFSYEVKACERVAFDRVHFHGSLDGDSSNDGSALGFSGCSDIAVTNSTFEQLARGVAISVSKNVLVAGNRFRDLRTDGADFAQVENVRVLDNDFRNFRPSATDHPDAIQFWTTGSTAPSRNILIAGNYAEKGEGQGTQFIFLRDQIGTLPYEGVTIERNFSLDTGYNGIRVIGAKDLTVRDNELVTVAPADGSKPYATFMLVEKGAGVLSQRNRSVNIAFGAALEASAGVVQEGDVVTKPLAQAEADAAKAAWLAKHRAAAPPATAEPDPRDVRIAELGAQAAALGGRIDALLVERAKALALAKQARAAKAKNQYLDPLVALLSAPAP